MGGFGSLPYFPSLILEVQTSPISTGAQALFLLELSSRVRPERRKGKLIIKKNFSVLLPGPLSSFTSDKRLSLLLLFVGVLSLGSLFSKHVYGILGFIFLSSNSFSFPMSTAKGTSKTVS